MLVVQTLMMPGSLSISLSLSVPFLSLPSSLPPSSPSFLSLNITGHAQFETPQLGESIPAAICVYMCIIMCTILTDYSESLLLLLEAELPTQLSAKQFCTQCSRISATLDWLLLLV